jgi:hypothetical protein
MTLSLCRNSSRRTRTGIGDQQPATDWLHHDVLNTFLLHENPYNWSGDRLMNTVNPRLLTWLVVEILQCGNFSCFSDTYPSYDWK